MPLGLNDPAERCGRAGPLHFDVGISSAASIVRFFGIAAETPRNVGADAPEGQPSAATPQPGSRPAATRNKPADPRDAIAAALRQAGIIDDAASPTPHARASAVDPRRIVATTLRAVGLLKD